MEGQKLLSYENVETIKKFIESVFNKLEYQIKSFRETADLTLSFTNEKITECFIKEF